MNGSLRSILSLAIMIAILVIIIRFVSFMLPYVLVAALVIFIYRKIKVILAHKKEGNEKASVYTTKPSEDENPFDSEDGEIIEVDDEFEGVEEYCLTDISSVFSTEMRGWGPCSAGFYEAMDLALDDLEDVFKKFSKEEFKEYVGNLKYAEYRCEEIYKRLEEIEEEASELYE